MRKERIDDLVDIIADKYSEIENTYLIRNNEQLVKYLENPSKWKAEQLKHRGAYKKALISIARSQISDLNDKLEKVLLLSYREVAKDSVEISEKEIIAKNIPSDLKKRIETLKKDNTKEVIKLADLSFKTYLRNVKIIGRESNADTLYDVIKKQVVKGVDNGIKIAYKDGKLFSWKAYMEMRTRTDVQHEVSRQQVSVGADVGQIFYICTSFGDCAKDHADYQGKIYYNDEVPNIPDEILKFIADNHILSMNDVMRSEPYLTTRPNCRHTFNAIPLSQATGMSEEEILKKNGLKYGEYDQKNYDLVQEQRYNERQIRKYKMRVENEKRLAKETGIKDFAPSKNAVEKIREYQARNRELAKENPEVIKRDYEREKIDVIVNDLGVKYDYKVVDGELKKKR